MGGTRVMSLTSQARQYPCCHESTLPVASATISSAKHAPMHKRTRGDHGPREGVVWVVSDVLQTI
jgi:hypothetical protein